MVCRFPGGRMALRSFEEGRNEWLGSNVFDMFR